MNNRVDFQILLPEQKSRYFGMTPLPDETSWSFVARAALLTGASDLRRVAFDLFGCHGTFDYPAARLHGGFQQLASHFVGFEGWDVDSLQNSLSFLPLFRPFLSDDRYSAVQRLSCEIGAHGLGKAAGIKRAGLLRRHAAVCLDCLVHDQTKHHVGYYHRVPQVAAVTVCPQHGSKLLSHCPACGLRLPKIPDLSCQGCGCVLRVGDSADDPAFDAHLRLARFAEACFSGTMPIVDPTSRLFVLQKRARERISTRSGLVGDNLATHLNRSFGRDYLNSLGWATDSGKTIGWPSLVINGQAWEVEIGPQLLLIALLFDSVEDFRDACLTQPRSESTQRIVQRRAQILWNKEIFFDLIRCGDVAEVAERHHVAAHLVHSWVTTYPGLSARLEARYSRRLKMNRRKAKRRTTVPGQKVVSTDNTLLKAAR